MAEEMLGRYLQTPPENLPLKPETVKDIWCLIFMKYRKNLERFKELSSRGLVKTMGQEPKELMWYRQVSQILALSPTGTAQPKRKLVVCLHGLLRRIHNEDLFKCVGPALEKVETASSAAVEKESVEVQTLSMECQDVEIMTEISEQKDSETQTTRPNREHAAQTEQVVLQSVDTQTTPTEVRDVDLMTDVPSVTVNNVQTDAHYPPDPLMYTTESKVCSGEPMSQSVKEAAVSVTDSNSHANEGRQRVYTRRQQGDSTCGKGAKKSSAHVTHNYATRGRDINKPISERQKEKFRRKGLRVKKI